MGGPLNQALPPKSSGGPLPQPRSRTVFPAEGEQHTIVVNKQTHRIRYQDETETQVIVVIEPKE